MGRFEVDRGVITCSCYREFFKTTSLFRRKKSPEVEGKGGQAAGDQGVNRGGGTWDDLDG